MVMEAGLVFDGQGAPIHPGDRLRPLGQPNTGYRRPPGRRKTVS
jgi:hypothetical protein